MFSEDILKCVMIADTWIRFRGLLGTDCKEIDFSFNIPRCSEYLLLRNLGQFDESR
jgi:hypothetical protein